jgi:hypothetical protein
LMSVYKACLLDLAIGLPIVMAMMFLGWVIAAHPIYLGWVLLAIILIGSALQIAYAIRMRRSW